MKSLVVFELPKDFNLTFKTEEEGLGLEDFSFIGCGPFCEKSIGFVETPLGSYLDLLSGGVELVCIRTQKKVPEKAHIEHLVEEKVKKLGSVHKKDLEKLKYEAFQEVLACTFPKKPEDRLVFLKDNYLFIEEASYKKAEVYVEMLEKFFATSLPLSPQEDFKNMIKMVNYGLPEPWLVGLSAKLIDLDERVISISKGDICCKVTEDLISSGAELDFMELEYDSIVTVKVKPSLEVKSLKFCSRFKILFGCPNVVKFCTKFEPG